MRAARIKREKEGEKRVLEKVMTTWGRHQHVKL